MSAPIAAVAEPAFPSHAAPRPDAIIDLILGYRQAKALFVAADSDCFARLERPRTASELAGLLGWDGRAAEILLDALTAMGYVSKESGLYRNTAIAGRFLVPGRPGYLGDNLKFQELIWEAWSGLGGAMKRGFPLRGLGAWLGRRRGFAREYIRGMDNIARKPAAEIAEVVACPGARSLLDVGAGPGTYSAAFLDRNPALKAALLDLPGTLKITREILSARPELAPRLRLKAGDYRRASFGRGEHDLVLMSHITHDESPEVVRRLLRKAHEALRPGGRIVIHDFLVDEDRVSPLFGALFSVHMLTYTRGGRTYAASEYRGWLEEAGFAGVWRRPIAINSRNSTAVLVATKS